MTGVQTCALPICVRQGKYFVLTLAGSLTPEAARAEVERVAGEVLTNPVIEEYTYRIED